MNIDLSARTAIISGSTGGIGLAIARGLARAHADVVIAGRSQSSVDAALTELRAQGGRGQVHGVVADLGSAAGAETLFVAHPKADILVNNLGIYDNVDFFEVRFIVRAGIKSNDLHEWGCRRINGKKQGARNTEP